MKKIIMNIKYKMMNQFSWTIWYLGSYLIVMLLSYIILLKTGIINSSTGSLSYRIWGVIFFQFAVSMRFKEDFDFFITLSSTRKEIFFSFIANAAVFSLFFSGLIILEKVIFDLINNILGFYIKDIFHYFAPYRINNFFLIYLFFLMLCLSCSAFGIMMGSLFYRFGKKFTLAFWLIFPSIPLVLFPLLLWPFNHENSFAGVFIKIGDFLKYFNVPSASGFLFLLTIIFCTAAYLNIRKLPQK